MVSILMSKVLTLSKTLANPFIIHYVGPGSFLGREMPIVEGRDWKERAFTVGIGGYVQFFSYSCICSLNIADPWVLARILMDNTIIIPEAPTDFLLSDFRQDRAYASPLPCASG